MQRTQPYDQMQDSVAAEFLGDKELFEATADAKAKCRKARMTFGSARFHKTRNFDAS